MLHDYVSFNWMVRWARRAWPDLQVSAMTFYPTAGEWRDAKNGSSAGSLRRFARSLVAAAGRLILLNLYFGDKIIVCKRIGGAAASRLPPAGCAAARRPDGPRADQGGHQ